MNGIEKFGRILGGVERTLEAFACVLLVVLLVLMNVEVVARYFFSKSTLVADEYGGYVMTWITMLGAVHLLRADQHLSMTWLLDKMSPRAKNAAGIVAALIGLLLSAVFLYSTSLMVMSSLKFGTVSLQPSKTPLAWVQFILPFGYFMLCLAYAEEIVRRLLGHPPRRANVITEGVL